MGGLYYNMTFNGAYPISRHAELATIPIIERGEIKRDRFSIAGRDGELLGTDVWRGNAHVRLTLHTRSDWNTPIRRNMDDNLESLKLWLSGTGELKLISTKEGTGSNFITHILEVLQITTNEIRKTNDYGRLEVDFEVYPYNFKASGQVEQSSSGNTLQIYNEYDECKPIYKISGSGSGTLTVTGATFGRTLDYTLTSGEELIIDTRRKIAYSGTTNKSNSINGDYENVWLGNGTTHISVSSGHTFKVTPYWGYKL